MNQDKIENLLDLVYNYDNYEVKFMTVPKPKSTQIPVQISPEEEALFVRMMQSSDKQCDIKLSTADQLTIAEALINPPEPSEKLVKAALDYNKKFAMKYASK